MPEARQDIFAEKISRQRDRGLGIVCAPQEQMVNPQDDSEALATYVRKLMRDKTLTVYAVQKEARRRGGTLGKSTVDAIIQGSIKNPGIYTLRELAWGLGCSIETLVNVALGHSAAESPAFQKSELAALWEMSQCLPLAEQRMFKRFVQMLERELRRVLGRDT